MLSSNFFGWIVLYIIIKLESCLSYTIKGFLSHVSDHVDDHMGYKTEKKFGST